jgi:hypothetical protein
LLLIGFVIEVSAPVPYGSGEMAAPAAGRLPDIRLVDRRKGGAMENDVDRREFLPGRQLSDFPPWIVD